MTDQEGSSRENGTVSDVALICFVGLDFAIAAETKYFMAKVTISLDWACAKGQLRVTLRPRPPID